MAKAGRRKIEPHIKQLEPKERILRCAFQQFQEKGYAGVSIRDVTSLAQATASTIYHHFGDKKGLYRAVILRLLEDILEELEQAQQRAGFEAQLIEILSVFYRYRLADVGTMLHEMATHEDFEVADLEVIGEIVNRRWRITIEVLLTKAVERNEIKSGNLAFYTQLIFDVGFSFAHSPLGNRTGWSEERYIYETAQILLNGFARGQKSTFI